MANPTATLVGSWTPVVGIPLKALPLELSMSIRDLLQPMDILNCARVSRDWRAYIYSPESLFDLVSKYQTHSPDDSAVIGVHDELMLRTKQSGSRPDVATLQARLEEAVQVIKAHHWGVPARACQPIEGAAAGGALSRLAGQYLMLGTPHGQLELLDLLHGQRYTSADMPSIYRITLTTLCFGYIFGNFIAYGALKNFANPLLLEWDNSIDDSELVRGIEDVGGELFNVMAIRSVKRSGQDGVGLLRINVQEITQEVAFVPAAIDHRSIAVIPDGDGCAIFMGYRTPARVKLIRMSTLHSEPVSSTLDLGDLEYWHHRQFEVRRIGYKRHVQLRVAERYYIVGLDDLTFTLEPGQYDLARWKESVFCADARRLEVRDLQCRMKSAFSHSEWYHCSDNFNKVMANDSFVVASHSSTEDCPGYHAYCFDQSLPVKELPRDGFERHF